jgi:DnaK suppressor protein
VKTSTQKTTGKVTTTKAKVKPVTKPVAAKKAAVKPAASAKTTAKPQAKPTAASKTPKAAPAPKSTKTPQAVAVVKKAPPLKSKLVASAPQKAVAAAPKPAPASKAKAAPAPSPKKTASVPETKSMTVKKVATPTPPVAQAAVTAVAAPAAPAAPDQLVRATRPSARLAQITVPSLPPAVASTAAKASFMPSSPVAVVSAPFAPIKKDPKLANNWKSKSVEQLTDAEILAMPESEYMNSVQMAYFRRKLATLKQEILNSAGATTEHLREDTVVVPDPADRATIEEEHALELRTRDRERKLLKKIEQSIGLIDAGEYGYCDETGEPIGVGRLLARPTATLSLEAQQRRELKQKMFGD